MKRRRLLVGLSGMAGAGGIVGSGAFTSVSAERSVQVAVADDDQALLAMEPTTGPNGTFASLNNGQITLDFDQTAAGGQGVGLDSIYNFDDVFRITNQGTQTVYAWVTFDFSNTPLSSDDVWLYPDGDSGTRLNDGDNSVVELPVGETVRMGVHVDTHPLSSLSDLTLDATIHANADKPDNSTSVTPGPGPILVSESGGDFSAIQPAVDAAIDQGRDIRIDPGEYVGDPSSTSFEVDVLDPDGLEIVGSGSGSDPSTSTIIDSEFDVQMDTTGSITFRNLRIGGAFGDGFQTRVNVTGPLRNLTFENAAVVDQFADGIVLEDDVEDLTLLDCLLEGNSGYGLEVSGTATNVDIENCQFLDQTVNSGILFEDSVQDLTIANTTVESNGIDGIQFNPGGGSVVIDVEISDSTVRSNTDGDPTDGDLQHGIAFQNGTFDVQRMAVSASDFDQNEGAGVRFGSGSVGTVTFSDSGFDGNGTYGIDASAVTSGTITLQNCTFQNNGSGPTVGPVS